jgi:hypothetical protein
MEFQVCNPILLFLLALAIVIIGILPKTNQ